MKWCKKTKKITKTIPFWKKCPCECGFVHCLQNKGACVWSEYRRSLLCWGEGLNYEQKIGMNKHNISTVDDNDWMWKFICDIFGNNYNKNQMKCVETEYFIYDNESNNKYNTHPFFCIRVENGKYNGQLFLIGRL